MGLGGLLGGKTKKLKKDKLANDINLAGKAGIGSMMGAGKIFDEVYGEDQQATTDRVTNQINRENSALLGGVNDAMKLSDRLTAQRGMGSSSIGLGNLINQRRQYSQAVGLNNASLMDRIRSARLENAQGRMTAGQGLWNIKQGSGPIRMETTKYKTGGGLGSLAGAAIGGYFGGAAGAQFGSQAGSYLENT